MDSFFPSVRKRLVCFNVRKLGWYAVSAVVAAIILGGVLLLAANLYVQSQAVQGQIRHSLASSLKMPVEITKTTVTPWQGVRIDGIRMRPKHAAEDFLVAASFRVQFALAPLLRGNLIVQSVLLDQPEVAWAQNHEGRWLYPPDGKEADTAPHLQRHKNSVPAASPPENLPAVEQSPAEPATTPASPPLEPFYPPAGTPPPPATPPESKRLPIAVDKLKLRHGVLNFLDARRQPIGRFDDVNLDSRVVSAEKATGAFWFDKASLPRIGLVLEDFRSGFTYDGNKLDLHHGTGKIAGGTIQLDYHLAAGENGSPFTAACHVNNVSLEELIVQAGGRPGLAEGRLQGDIEAAGDAGDAESRRATGRIRLTDARFANLPILQTIGEALRIEDIRRLQFKKAQLDCALDGLVLQVNPLVLVSNDLQIDARGDYRLDNDRLNLHARLRIDENIGRQLPKFIEGNFQPCGDEAPGSRYMDFDITGTMSRPKSNLLTKIVSGSANNLLQSLFGTKKKHDKKPPKNDAAPSPAADAANDDDDDG